MLAVDWDQGIEDAWNDLTGFLPEAIAAIIVLAVGYFVARMIQKIVARVLDKIKFDTYVDKAGIGGPVERAGYPNSGELLAKLIFYGVMLMVLQIAVNVFGDSEVSEAFDDLIGFVPRLFIAIIIVVVTGVIAATVRSLIEPAVAHLESGKFLATLAYTAIWIVGLFAAFDHLDIASDTVDTLFTALVYGLVATLVVMFGVGGIWAARDRFWPAVFDKVSNATATEDDAAPTAAQSSPTDGSAT